MIKNCMLEFQKQDIHVVSGISKFIRGYDSSSFIGSNHIICSTSTFQNIIEILR